MIGVSPGFSRKTLCREVQTITDDSDTTISDDPYMASRSSGHVLSVWFETRVKGIKLVTMNKGTKERLEVQTTKRHES